MDEYDLMLSIDRVAREHGMSAAEVTSALNAHQSGGTAGAGQPNQTNVEDTAMHGGPKGDDGRSYEEILAAGRAEPIAHAGSQDERGLEPAPFSSRAATVLPDASRYRLGYDPTSQGQQRQDQIDQAIVCPACSAPLGIPSVRPIKVTCPQCLAETTFDV